MSYDNNAITKNIEIPHIQGKSDAIIRNATTKQDAKKAGAEFAQYFLAHMLRTAGATHLGGHSLEGENNTANDVFNDWLLDEYAKQISPNLKLGVDHIVTNELIKIQENASEKTFIKERK